MFKIDKEIPIPEQVRKTEYPFEQMEVGDSFFAEGKTTDQLGNASGHWRKKKGWGFTIRKETSEDGKNGARIWRIR